MLPGPPDLPSSDEVDEAGWIAGRLHHFGEDAGSVVPVGFQAYARIDHAPQQGVLPEPAASALARVLAGHTATPSDCWFGLWAGYGYLTPGTAVRWLEAGHPHRPPRPARFRISLRRRRDPAGGRPLVKLPHRDYLLYRGAVEQAPGWPDGPNLWWPGDRAWFVASEMDLTRTYVGGAATTIEALLADRDARARPASIDEPLAG
jgi:hypothetical protein